MEFRRWPPLSLKTRLGVVFSGLLVLAISFSSAMLYQQQRTAIRGDKIALRAHAEMVNAIEMRESLTEIHRKAILLESVNYEVVRFQKLLERLKSDPEVQIEDSSAELINQLASRFEALKEVLSTVSSSPVRGKRDLIQSRFDDTAAALAAYIEMNQNSVYRMADGMRRDQERTANTAFFILISFILLISFAAFKVISIITHPLSMLVDYLDRIDVEKDLPENLPKFGSDIPEVSHVARSFERLLQRLRGYRMLNIRRLLLEKRRADIIAGSTSDGIFLLRGDEILYVNSIGERILGIRSPATGMDSSTQPGINLNMLGALPNEEGAGARAVLSATSRTIPVEFTLPQEDRTLFYLIRAFPISFDLIDQVDCSVSGAMDKILEKFQANMLIVAQDVTIVRESQEAKSHFLGTLSHEVKTPVTSLTMATRLLKKSIEEIPNPMHRSLILTCVEDVDRLRGLLEDLLNVTRFETLTQRLAIQNVDIAKLLKHAVQSFQFQAKEKGVELLFQFPPQEAHPVIPIDPTKISWAVSNLIANAVRHTPRSGRVEIALLTHEDSAEIRIRDTGPGMDRKRQSKVFEKFTSFYDIRIARSGSVGVGLAIAREIIGAHGGRIWVSSEVGQGAEFGFTLPMKARETSDVLSADGDGHSSVLTQEWTSMKGASRGTSARGG